MLPKCFKHIKDAYSLLKKICYKLEEFTDSKETLSLVKAANNSWVLAKVLRVE